MIKNVLFWSFPVMNSITVGLILWAERGFDTSQVIVQWIEIGVIIAVYLAVLIGLPIYAPARRRSQPEYTRFTVPAHPTMREMSRSVQQ